MRSDFRQRLIDVAKRGETITYGNLMREFGISRGQIGSVVGEISAHEKDQERPLISAIVVRTQSGTKICPKGTPSGGFFGLPGIPNHLNRPASEHSNPRLTEAEQQFINSEQQKVWEYWRSH